MRRFVSLAVLLFFTIPFGISISGCSKGAKAVSCSADGSGPLVGQVTTITLLPKIYGISLNQGQIGQVATPTATDCNGNTVNVSSYTYGVFDATGHAIAAPYIADVVPSGANAGKLCAGQWNRNTGGGIPDYTTCNVTGLAGEVYVVASGGGANSNPLPIFIHPKVTSIVLGSPTTDCTNDPTSNCCPLAAQATVTAPAYTGTACISQGKTAQLVARAFDSNGNNITCQVGHLSFAAQTTSVATIDENGVVTAQQPGSTVISANLTQAGSSAGFFSTCPPVKIAMTVPNTGGKTNIVVNQNNTQPLSAVATDINNTILTGLALTFISTTPITIPAASTGTVTPAFPGAASITAICQPPTCNPSPINQIGLFGNGTPVASNPVTVTTPGTNSTLLWIGSTQSRYILPIDFTNLTTGAPVRLPLAPNSMVLSNDGASIYMGTTTEIMVFNATTNSLTKEDASVAGQVLAISPDGTTLVVSDPRKQLTYLYTTSSGTISSTYGGVAMRAQFTPDSATAYITLGSVDVNGNVVPGNQLLVHSSFTGWNLVGLGANATDVAVTVPSVGAYLAGASTTGRSYCPSTTITGTPPNTTSITNAYYPLADTATVPTDRVAATNDGLHILGATVTGGASIVDLAFQAGTSSTPGGLPIGQCPAPVPATYFTANRISQNSIPMGVTATAITGVIPTSDSSVAMVTYTGSGSLPVYTPATGALTQVALTGGATAPVAGAISSDNTTFYVGTSGDNQVHLISRSTLKDDPTQTINPKLPQYVCPNSTGSTCSNGTDAPSTYVTPNLVVQHPRKATS
ncbi:hypothetical protein [Edaphobacter flagellatus]|uniref:hypothetical protein n=1 Tax=Edaphobacter flagellatus TaxID=1933044 RepID=UPI0021B20807|nr:hypothetical protein [Edaphobacter flagellatus]